MIANPFPLPADRSKTGILSYLLKKHQLTRFLTKRPIRDSHPDLIETHLQESSNKDLKTALTTEGRHTTSGNERILFLYNQIDFPVWHKDSEHPLFAELSELQNQFHTDSIVIIIDRINGSDRPQLSTIFRWLSQKYPNHQIGTRFNMLLCQPKSPLSPPETWAQDAPDFEPEPYIELPEGMKIVPTQFFDERSATQYGYSNLQCISCLAITTNGNSFENLEALCRCIQYARTHRIRRIYSQEISWLPYGEHLLSDGLTIVNRSNAIYSDEEVILAGTHLSWHPIDPLDSNASLQIAREFLPFMNQLTLADDPPTDLCIHLGPSPKIGQYHEPNTRSDRADLLFYRRILDLQSWKTVQFVSRSSNHRAIPEIEAGRSNFKYPVPRIATEAEEIEFLLHSTTLVLCPFDPAPSLTAIHLSQTIKTLITTHDSFIGRIPEHIQILRI